jgi:hypothetical protein
MDTSKMSPAMRRIWERPAERPNILQRARNREIGLDKLYGPATREERQIARDLIEAAALETEQRKDKGNG